MVWKTGNWTLKKILETLPKKLALLSLGGKPLEMPKVALGKLIQNEVKVHPTQEFSQKGRKKPSSISWVF